jgi:hypothetical protein
LADILLVVGVMSLRRSVHTVGAGSGSGHVAETSGKLAVEDSEVGKRRPRDSQ